MSWSIMAFVDATIPCMGELAAGQRPRAGPKYFMVFFQTVHAAHADPLYHSCSRKEILQVFVLSQQLPLHSHPVLLVNDSSQTSRNGGNSSLYFT